jgi:hypothetical protein
MTDALNMEKMAQQIWKDGSECRMMVLGGRLLIEIPLSVEQLERIHVFENDGAAVAAVNICQNREYILWPNSKMQDFGIYETARFAALVMFCRELIKRYPEHADDLQKLLDFQLRIGEPVEPRVVKIEDATDGIIASTDDDELDSN